MTGERDCWLVEYFSDETAEDSYVGGAIACDTEEEAKQVAEGMRMHGWTVPEPKATVCLD